MESVESSLFSSRWSDITFPHISILASGKLSCYVSSNIVKFCGLTIKSSSFSYRNEIHACDIL